MKYSVLFLCIIAVAGLIACEKAVSFTPADAEPKLVVDATIENGQPPIVTLSNSLDYFSQISPQILLSSFVRNAEVFVSNGTKTHKQYVNDLGGGFKFYFYSIDSASLATAFLGEFNTSYTLRILVNGREYNARTSIPKLNKGPDSLWWKPAPANPDTSYVVLMVKVTDPPGFGNYTRVFNRRNSEPFYPLENSVFDDQFTDGSTYEVPFDRGFNRNNPDPLKEGENKIFFKRGDTITGKISNIDKATYEFWSTMEYNYQNIGNPFSSPVKVIGNISNGALGHFGGYASSTRTVMVPK
jgi:Domain of unknown function (DUF4249)